MKKIIAVLLSLIMMLSVSACAAGVEIRLNGMTLIENNEVVMEMPDPGIRLAFAQNDAGMGLRAALVANGQTALEAVLTLGAEKLLAKATGISSVYSVSLADLAPIAEQAMGSLPQVSGFQPTEADMAIVNEMVATITAAVESGVYYSEDGATMGVAIDDATIRTLLGQVITLAKNHPELLAYAELSAEDLDMIAIPEDVTITVDAHLSYTETGLTGAADLYVTEGDMTGKISLGFETDAASYVALIGNIVENDTILQGLNINFGFTMDEGAWLIAEDTAAIDVFSMTEEQMNTLTTEAEALLNMFGLAG